MVAYTRRRTMIPCCLALILCLLPPSVEGSLFATRRSAIADRHHTGGIIAKPSTWNQQSNIHHSASTAIAYSNIHHGAFVSSHDHVSRKGRRKPISSSSSSRLAFLSNFLVHQSSATSQHKIMMHPLRHLQTKPSILQRNHCLLFSSKETENANDDDDEPCAIQKLYEQVEQDDSDWYYQTFSKLLDEEPTIPPCADEGAVAKEKGKTSGDVSREVESDEDEEGEMGVEIMKVEEGGARNSDGNTVPLKNDEQVLDQKDSEEIAETDNLEKEESVASNVSQQEDKEVPQSIPASEEKQGPELQQSQPSMGQGKKEQVRPLEEKLPELVEQQSVEEEEAEEEEYGRYSPKSKRWAEEEEDYEPDQDDEYDDGPTDEYDDYYDKKEQPQQRQQPVQNKKPLSKPSSDTVQPSPIVRLRNTYTNEIENLAPLTLLSKLGYSEKELIVLRPQVLELIVDDGIPRPAKGLPKRWVRLNKLDGYDGEVKEEDDGDVDWEVEVVSRKVGKKKEADDVAEEPKDVESKKGGAEPYPFQEIDEPEYSSKTKGGFPDDDELVDLDDEPILDEGSNISQQAEQYPYAENPEFVPTKNSKSDNKVASNQMSESQGPSTSSRVSDDEKVRSEATVSNKAERDVQEEDAEKQQRRQRQPQRQPMKAEEEDDSYGGGYDAGGGRDEYNRQRRPQRQRRQQRRDDDEYDEPRSSASKSQQRPREEKQQRQRRSRPPSQRRELLIDRGDNEDAPPNKFWMDLPTFRGFLRNEAQLRLKILGPDWKESVLDESRWRYDLYKTWLVMLDEGVGGDNPLYEYGDRPREARGRMRRESESRQQEPQRQSRGDGERGYDRPRTRSSQSRPTRQQQDRSYDDEEYDDRSKTRRRPTPSGMQGEGERGRESRRGEPRAYSDQRPPPPRKSRTANWKNFSDLEESLLGSSKERPQSERSYDDDYNETFQDEDEDAPRRRNRPRTSGSGSEQRPQQRGYAAKRSTNDDVPYEEEEYDDSEKDIEEAPTRRRGRAAGSNAEPRSRGQYTKRSREDIEEDYDDRLEGR